MNMPKFFVKPTKNDKINLGINILLIIMITIGVISMVVDFISLGRKDVTSMGISDDPQYEQMVDGVEPDDLEPQDRQVLLAQHKSSNVVPISCNSYYTKVMTIGHFVSPRNHDLKPTLGVVALDYLKKDIRVDMLPVGEQDDVVACFANITMNHYGEQVHLNSVRVIIYPGDDTDVTFRVITPSNISDNQLKNFVEHANRLTVNYINQVGGEDRLPELIRPGLIKIMNELDKSGRDVSELHSHLM